MIIEHRILVTGGAGFLGSHLAEKLLEAGNKVICVDNFFSGSPRNIEHLLDHENFEFHRHDICQPLNLAVDEIYNFASIGSSIPPKETLRTINSETTETSVYGAVNVLELARQCDCKIFQASGCEIYDDAVLEPQEEHPAPKHNQLRYLASYGAGRRFAETLVFDLSREYGLDFKIGRIFNAYGPRMPLGEAGSVGEFVVRALQGEDLVVAGDGSRVQAPSYVDDVVKSCIRLMDRPRAISGPVDIGARRGNQHDGAGQAHQILDRLIIENRDFKNAGRAAASPPGSKGEPRNTGLRSRHAAGDRADADDRIFRRAAEGGRA
jgi:UDP-glucuronate decarboxylase